MPLPAPFVDYYELLEADPSTSASELKIKYFRLLRKYHPDKRQTLINGVGHKMTQALNEAWSVLSDPVKREAYDVQWRREKNKHAPHVGGFGAFASDARNRAPQRARPDLRREDSANGQPSNVRRHGPPRPSKWFNDGSPGRPFRRQPFSARAHDAGTAADPSEQRRPATDGFQRQPSDLDHDEAARADALRKEGNAMFKAGKKLGQVDSHHFGADIAAAMLHSYKKAISKYSAAVDLTPSDHRLYTNRALCYLETKEWIRCHEDAKKATQLQPDFMKGWFLLVKSSMRQGNATVAKFELDMALNILPNSEELLGLKAELVTYRHTNQDAPRNPSGCGPEEKPSKPKMHRAESCPPPAPPTSARASAGRPPWQPRDPPRPGSGARRKNNDRDHLKGNSSLDGMSKPVDVEEAMPPSRAQWPPDALNSGVGYNCRAGGC